MSHAVQSSSRFGQFVDTLEETIIAILLGAMVIVTFINVVLRYGYNTGLIWGLEVTLYLFAWLVLFGISYAIKVSAHLGVDAVVNLLPTTPRKWLMVFGGIICIIYAALLMKGAWDYFAPFAGFNATSGRWFPTGFANTRDQAWYETSDIPFPAVLGFLQDWFNQGETYNKLPRFIPYVMLPFGTALMLFRFVQVTVRLATGRSQTLIASHEAEDAVEEAARSLKEG